MLCCAFYSPDLHPCTCSSTTGPVPPSSCARLVPLSASPVLVSALQPYRSPTKTRRNRDSEARFVAPAQASERASERDTFAGALAGETCNVFDNGRRRKRSPPSWLHERAALHVVSKAIPLMSGLSARSVGLHRRQRMGGSGRDSVWLSFGRREV